MSTNFIPSEEGHSFAREMTSASRDTTLSDSGQKHQHENTTYYAIHRKRRESPLPHPCHEPRHRGVSYEKRHDESDGQHNPSVRVDLRNPNRIRSLAAQRFQQIIE